MNQSAFSEHVLQEWVARADETLGAVMRHVYLWMFVGLFVTAAVSLALIYTPLISLFIYILETPLLFYGLLIGELILVMFLRARVFSMPAIAAQAIFILYAILNGVTLSVIFLVYVESSIAVAFFSTASMFGAMSILGYTTRIDLTKFGSWLLMGLLGFVIASVANLFFASSSLDWVLTYIGILLFIGLTVYDTQQIRIMIAAALATGNTAQLQQIGILGALKLYLDFINLFLLILRLLGRRRR